MAARWPQWQAVASAVRRAARVLGALLHIVSLRRTERAYAVAVRELVALLDDDTGVVTRPHTLSPAMRTLRLRDYSELFEHPADEEHDDAADRRCKLVYEQVARREVAASRLALLTSPEAIALQRPMVAALFDRLLGLRLGDRALDAVSRYGSASAALGDFLRHCGYASGLMVGRIRVSDIDAFVTFATWQHQWMALDGRHGPSLFGPLTVSWSNVKALYGRRRLEREHRARKDEWLNTRAGAHRGTARRRLAQQIAYDAAIQQGAADRLAFAHYAHALTCITQAAALAFARTPSTAAANRHAATLAAGMQRLRLMLTDALDRNQHVRS